MGSKASLIYQLQPGRPEKDELAPGACSGEEGAWEQPCHGRGGRLSPPDPASLWEDEARSCRIALCKSRYFVISPGRLGQEDAPVWRGAPWTQTRSSAPHPCSVGPCRRGWRAGWSYGLRATWHNVAVIDLRSGPGSAIYHLRDRDQVTYRLPAGHHGTDFGLEPGLCPLAAARPRASSSVALCLSFHSCKMKVVTVVNF